LTQKHKLSKRIIERLPQDARYLTYMGMEVTS